MTADPALDILLVEDNPGDARYIREILPEATELSERTRTDDDVMAEGGIHRSGGKPDISHETRLAPALERLDEKRPDAVLLDLGLPDSTGLETLGAVLERDEAVPVVVLTGLSDREIGLEALRRGADDYLVKDEINADLLIRSVYHAIERNAQERRLERQRERLEAMNQLNTVVQRITHAVIDQSTREEIEATVCERLAAAPSYERAWIGEVDSTTDTVVRRTEAGADGRPDDAALSIDLDDSGGEGPVATAIRTGEIQVFAGAGDFGSERAERNGCRSGVAIPIAHEGSLYGVLCAYASRSDAFAGEEREVIGQIGEIVGHAIAAVERKRSLMSDEVLEVDLSLGDPASDAESTVDFEAPVTLERAVPVGDEHRVYGTAAADDVAAVEALVDALPHWTGMDVVAQDGDRATFELSTSSPPILTILASHSGHVASAEIDDGDYRVTAHLPHNAGVRELVESVREVYPETEVQAQRLVTRDGDGRDRLLSAFEERLTERQRAILETAYFRGYFEWPRESSGEEIADSLDLSAPTFSEHLRGAEARIFAALFEDETDE